MKNAGGMQSGVAVALIVLSVLAACSDAVAPTPTQGPAVVALRSGGSGSGGSGGSGGGGGGGGGGGSTRPCAILTFDIINNLALSTNVAPFWQPNSYYYAQATGSTEKSCDALPGAVMTFADISGLNDGCEPRIPQFVGATYLKYGLKPMSRYSIAFPYFTGTTCLGITRTIQATLTDTATGTVLGRTSKTWLVL